MKKIMFIAPVAFLATFLILGTVYAHAPGSGFAQPQQNGWYCPYGAYQGGYGMGYGMMGYGMGPGMMGLGYGYNQQSQQPQRSITEKDAKGIVGNYLKLGKIKDEGSVFEVDIVTKSNDSLVDKVLVSKNTGWLRSVY